MLRNFFLTAWRNIRKNKLFSIINILGLSVGIALCFVIMLYVQDELSYDKYNKNADNIVRVNFKANIEGGKIDESGVMPPVAKTFKQDYPEVRDATRLVPLGSRTFTYGNKVFKNDRVAVVDPNFFDIFTLPAIKGNGKLALNDPNGLVITSSTAQKFFGDENPIGKTLESEGALYTIAAVTEDIPANSHFHFDIFKSMKGLKDATSDSWMYGNYRTYLLLKTGTDLQKMQSKFPAMVEKYMGPQVQQQMGISLSQFTSKGNQLGFVLQRLTDIHLHADTTSELEPGGNESYVYIFGAIGLFMLIVACINFVNLSTAGATKRAKEVGIRKVTGSGRWQLIAQFLSESLLVTCFALVVAFVIVQLSLPAFNQIAGKELHMDVKPWIAFIGLGLIVGLLAGIYPAFYLSSFNPIAVLKGKRLATNKSFRLRSSLVVFQFFISVGLIIGTIVVYQQMKYIQNKQLGYDKEHVITIPNSYVLGNNEQVFKQQMLADTRVVNATVSWYKPAGVTNNNNALAYPEGHDQQTMRAVEYHVDEQYVPTFGIRMASGRNFSKEYTTDSMAMLINETAARSFGWNTSTALGKTIIRINSHRGTNVPFRVVGVTKDFHFQSLHDPITPLLMTLNPEGGLIFKIKGTEVSALLATMKNKWDAFNTGEPFTYAFMDELYNKTYAAEQKTGTILNIFALLTVFVACLGLFGLATYTAEQRTKEIGIRKVLGATVAEVTGMLSREFIKLVLIASLIAFPAAWWAMNAWLQSFAYRINISWWVFAVAGIATLSIALITVSLQTIKAALMNPVKSLRTE
jgi:putative ABC transport system permease protein